MSYWFQQRNSQYSSGSSTSHRPSSSSYRYNDDDDRDDGTSRPLPCSDLWDFILDMDWQRVIEHTKHSPQDAEYLDGHWHETPLYSICQMSDNTSLPVEAVQAIINAYPNAIRIASRSNRDLPIHIACRYQASIEIIKLLVEDYPVTAVEQTRWGKTPLMTLWEFRKHNDTISPMELEEFWEKVHILLIAVAKYRCIANGSTNTPRLKRGRNFGGQQEEEQLEADDQDLSRYIVHAAVSLGSLCCPSDVLQYLLEKYPDQAKTYDPWGYLPLHIAVGPTPWSSIRKTTSSTSSNTTSTSATTTRRRMDTTTTTSTTTNTRRQRREQQVLQYILQSYPDPWGLLPMQISHTIPNGNNNSNGNDNDMDTTAAAAAAANRQPPTPSSPWIVTMMTGRKYKPREQRVLKLLLQSYPDAANERMANDSNRYPLHSAIANRHTWTGGLKVSFGSWIVVICVCCDLSILVTH